MKRAWLVGLLVLAACGSKNNAIGVDIIVEPGER